jgi:predicted nucleic acid-binding Zn ribbon protein
MLPPFRFTPPLGPGKKSSRQRVLAQWRRVDLVPLEKVWNTKAKRAADALPKVLSEMRLDRRQSEAEVVKVWNQLIDPTIAAHAQPTGLRKGTLFVSVDSSTWLSEIVRYRRKEILDRLQHSFGRDLIVKISFRLA